MATNPAWEYKDNAGKKHIGYVEKTIDKGGTDVTYIFRDSETGEVSVISGSRLKDAKRLWNQTVEHRKTNPRKTRKRNSMTIIGANARKRATKRKSNPKRKTNQIKKSDKVNNFEIWMKSGVGESWKPVAEFSQKKRAYEYAKALHAANPDSYVQVNDRR